SDLTRCSEYVPRGRTTPANLPQVSVRTCVTAFPGANPGVVTGSLHVPPTPQSDAARQVRAASPAQRPRRVTTMLAATSGVSAASTSPAIVPVADPLRAASSEIISSPTLRPSLRAPT